MQNKKIIYSISGGILLLSLIFGGFIFYSNQKVNQGDLESIVEIEGIYLKFDKGLNIEYVDIQSLGVQYGNIDSGSTGERVIFERYRFYDTKTNEQIDIRDSYVKVFVTTPYGREQQITTGNIYYLMHIYPLAEGGEYVFRLETADGKEYTAKLNFPKPKRVELVLGEEQKSLDTEGIFMRAFSMKGIDMANVEFVYHILSDNAVVAISSNADGKFLV